MPPTTVDQTRQVSPHPSDDVRSHAFSDTHQITIKDHSRRIFPNFDPVYERALLSTFAHPVNGFVVGNCELWESNDNSSYAIVIFDGSEGTPDQQTSLALDQLYDLINSRRAELNFDQSNREAILTRGLDFIEPYRSTELTPCTARALMKPISPNQPSAEELLREVELLRQASHPTLVSISSPPTVSSNGDQHEPNTETNPKPSEPAPTSGTELIKRTPKSDSGILKTHGLEEVKPITEIKTFEDFCILVNAIELALSEIKESGLQLLDLLSEARPNGQYIRLVETLDAVGHPTSKAIKVADAKKLGSSNEKFMLASKLNPINKALNRLNKAVEFYCMNASLLGKQTSEEVHDDNSLRLITFNEYVYEFSPDICALFGTREEANEVLMLDRVIAQENAQKILPYYMTTRRSLARLIHYSLFFPKEINKLTNGLNIESIEQGLRRNDVPVSDRGKYLDPLQRFKLYFIEKVRGTEVQTPDGETLINDEEALMSTILKLCIRLKNYFPTDLMQTPLGQTLNKRASIAESLYKMHCRTHSNISLGTF